MWAIQKSKEAQIKQQYGLINSAIISSGIEHEMWCELHAEIIVKLTELDFRGDYNIYICIGIMHKQSYGSGVLPCARWPKMVQ